MVEQPEGWNEYRRLVLGSLEELNRRVGDLNTKLDNFRSTMVSTEEHRAVRERVDTLWNRDLGARGDWEEMLHRVGVLWQERSENQGARRGYRLVIAGLSVIVTVLTVFTLLRSLGVNITLGHA